MAVQKMQKFAVAPAFLPPLLASVVADLQIGRPRKFIRGPKGRPQKAAPTSLAFQSENGARSPTPVFFDKECAKD